MRLSAKSLVLHRGPYLDMGWQGQTQQPDQVGILWGRLVSTW